jgi:SAM-dependent methyltransferase
MNSDGLPHDLPFSPAAERNREPILAVLRRWLGAGEPGRPVRLLEVGSGTGQHAVHMARALAGLHWQPTELPPALAGLRARIEREGASGLAPGARIAPPLPLDVNQPDWPPGPWDAVFSANTAHIMPAAAVPALLAGAARVLRPGGLLLLYGPFRYGERHTAASNAAFDEHLRSLDPAMGIRDAHRLAAQAAEVGLELQDDVAMPANNRTLVFERIATERP